MKLACWSAILMLAACSSPSPEDDLKDLSARVATNCMPLLDRTDTSTTVDCLNTALQTKTVAFAGWEHWEGGASECIEYWSFFTVAGEVRVFERVSDCGNSDTNTLTEQTCPGPFIADNAAPALWMQITGCTIDGQL